MLPEAYINIVLQTFGGMLSLLMLVFLHFVRPEHDRLSRLYIRFLLANTLIQIFNIMSWYFHDRPGTAIHILLVLIDFLLFIFHYLLLGTLTDYLTAFLEKNGADCRRFSRIVWGIALLGIGLVVVSQFNGMYYTIDDQNAYIRHSGVYIYAAIGITGAVIDLFLFIYHRKKLQTKEYQIFTGCLILAVASLVFQAVILGAFYLYITSTFVAICIYIFIQLEQSRRLNEQALELEKIQAALIQKELELERSRTAVMLSQIQPHFLYNVLTGIKTLCASCPEQAEEAVEHFSFFLRRNLDSLSNIQLITFNQEIIHVKDYFFLEKMRFKNLVNLVLELEYLDFLLPPLTLQPLVENAVRYGITRKEQGGTIRIRSEKKNDMILITISDDGMGFDLNAPDTSGRTHTGIENVRSRLELQCNASLEIQSEKGLGTTVHITLPLKDESI